MIGQTVSHYRLTEKLGEGGMGVATALTRLRLGWLLSSVLAVPLGTLSPAHAQSNFTLEFLADLNVPTGRTFEQLGQQPAEAQISLASEQRLSRQEVARRKASGEFGGISALAYEPSSQTLYALSDSTNPTIFALTLKLDPPVLQLQPKSVVRLRDEQGLPVPLWTLDPEGIALAPDGSFLIASEGYVQLDPPVQAAILRFNANGWRAGSYSIPGHFLRYPNGKAEGVRPNKGFESLSLSPDGEALFVATEGYLAQDGIGCAGDGICPVRILLYPAAQTNESAIAEFLYRHEPPEAPADFGKARKSMGLSEILALDAGNLLMLERGFSIAADGRTHQVARIFHVEIPRAAAFSTPTLHKRLVLDLATVTGQFSAGYRTLDNFEGMCLGPRLEGGDRSVLVVSDNNYNERQRTTFLAFRLKQR